MPATAFDDLLATLPRSAGHADRPRPRAPAHVIYGGAHLYKSGSTTRLAELARAFTTQWLPDAPALARLFDGLLPGDVDAAHLHAALLHKLSTAAVEDQRIDFEDGFGPRTDAEEDAEAERTAREVAAALVSGSAPSTLGIRIRALDTHTAARALRTLDRHLTTLAALAPVPPGYRVTLPKVEGPRQVEVLAAALARLEKRLGLATDTLALEFMAELPGAIVDPRGRLAAAHIVDVAEGRCRAVHFGAYDYLSSLGVPAREQRLDHPACDTARGLLQLALAGTDATLSDGATTLLPIAPHKTPATDTQRLENETTLRAALRLHFTNVHRALANGIPQGWDLHPHQLVARWTAVLAFHRHAFDAAVTRLARFLDHAAKAVQAGGTFDDAATAQGLLNAVVDAVDSGAVPVVELERATGRTIDALRKRDFAALSGTRA